MDAKLSDNRYFGVIFLVPILASFFIGGIFLHLMVGLMSIRALYEFYTVVSVKKENPMTVLGYVIAIFMYSIIYYVVDDLNVIAVMIILVTVGTLVISVFDRKYSFNDAALAVFGFIYTCVFFALILLIYDMSNGNWYILTIFTTSWVVDTFAYYSGRFYGKRKLIPEVSPKKTVEGAIGGLIGGALATFILGIILYFTIPGIIHPIHFLIFGVLGSAMSQIGDLMASAIKRDCGVKDYPKLIPGHGGILDRFDSVLLAGASLFIYLSLVAGL